MGSILHDSPASSPPLSASIPSFPASTPSFPALVPIKKEPKLEPLDLDDDVFDAAAFLTPTTPSSFPFTFNQPTSSSLTSPTTTTTTTTTPPDVYSEFMRISQLFHSAFAHEESLQQDDFAHLFEDPNNCTAIVPLNTQEPQQQQLSNPKKSPAQQRSKELVRVSELSPQEVLHYRCLVRKTRLAYDSLRIFTSVADEKLRPLLDKRFHSRADLKAAAVMKDRGLWLHRDKRLVGSIPGVEVGDVYIFRMELCVVGLHGQVQAGIDYLPASHSSNGEPIATSVIVSGGYEDDEDTGDEIDYTGQGGQDKQFRQCQDQKLECGNLALERSMHYGIEVRVIRGFKFEGSPNGKVYVYDGLYRVTDTKFHIGKSGFGVFKYKLVRIENQPQMGSSILRFALALQTRPHEVRPKGYVTYDLSMKKENVPVFLFNDVDNNHEPAFFDYLVSAVFPQIVHESRKEQGQGCDCVNGCVDGCFCATRNGGELPYDHKGILIRGKPVVLECGPHCRCPPTCRNRVSQRGVRNRFEVFRSRETGWGVRSLDMIQAGAFLCEFSGVALTHQQAEIFTMNGDSLVYPSRFAERWMEWGDLSDIFSNYVRPSHPSIPPLDFAMDVSRLRNVACYLSHSTSPNVFVQHVLYDHENGSFPHIMLFALENIPPLRELSLDYGVDDEWTGKLAICDS